MAASTNLTTEQRRLRAQLAGLMSAASNTPAERMAPAARKTPAQRPFWERKVRADSPELDDAEVSRRAELLHRAHMTRLALASSKARAARKTVAQESADVSP